MRKKIKQNNLFEINYKDNITKIKLKKDIINDSLTFSRIDNTFITFISKDKYPIIIYSTEDLTINCFDFIKEKIIKSIKNAHLSIILSFRYGYNKTQNKEYIVSVSIDKNIKFWNFPDFTCIISIEKAHRSGFIFSLCLLSLKNNNYIISSSGSDEENIRVWDDRGNKIKEIINSKERTGFIDNYYSVKKDKYYIVIANYGNIKSYDFISNELYKTYEDNSEEKNDHINFIIYDKNEELNNTIILIDSCYDGYIRLWDFDIGILLKKIKCSNLDNKLRNICLSENKRYLFTACDNNCYIKIIDLYQNKITTCIKVKETDFFTIKLIQHNLYGEYVITKGFLKDSIKL